MQDPFPEVDGSGITQLKEAGIEVTVGVARQKPQQLNAPYHEADSTSPLDHWQMGDDAGWKIATRSAQVSGSPMNNPAIVHDLRGRVDAVMVGHQTGIG